MARAGRKKGAGKKKSAGRQNEARLQSNPSRCHVALIRSAVACPPPRDPTAGSSTEVRAAPQAERRGGAQGESEQQLTGSTLSEDEGSKQEGAA